MFNRNIIYTDDFLDSYLDIAQVTEICHPLGTQLICSLPVRRLNWYDYDPRCHSAVAIPGQKGELI